MKGRRRGGSSSGGRGSGGPPLVIDPTLGDPGARAAVAAVEARDTGGLLNALRSLDDQAHFDFVLGIIAKGHHRPTDALKAWMAAQPVDDPVARTALGVLLVGDAWAIRTAARAPDVSRDQFERFWIVLREAEAVLLDVVRVHPEAGAAWRSLLDAGRGLQISKEELGQMFLRCDQGSPMFLPACQSYLQGICEKWSGSFEQSLAFANWAAARCGDGHYGPMLIAEAYFEHVVEHPEVAGSPQAINDVRAALDRTRLASPEWGNDRMGIAAKNLFAATAVRLRDTEVATHMLQVIGFHPGRVTAFPWNYTGDPGTAFSNAGRWFGLW